MAVEQDAISLAYEFTYWASLKPPIQLGAGPFGTRLYNEVTGGEVEGERLRGRLLTGGGDWLLIGPDGFGRLDVRAQIETVDGALIYMTYQGLLELNDAVQRALGTGAGTKYADHYFRASPRLESGDARYAWVNQTLFVAAGRLRTGSVPAVEYQVFRVT